MRLDMWKGRRYILPGLPNWDGLKLIAPCGGVTRPEDPELSSD